MGNILRTTNNEAIQAIRDRNQLPFVINKSSQSLGEPQNNQLTFLSYNVLADCYKHVFLFSIPWKHLDFNYRSNVIVEEIKSFSADIICLQEVDHFEDFYKEKLEALGYEINYKQKNRRKDGCLIGTKKDVFERIKRVDLSFDKGHRYDNRSEFIRGTIAIVLTMKHKPSGKIINIINTHLFWDPKFEHVRYLQISEIFKYIKKNFDEKDIIVWAGDMNSKPRSNTVKYIIENFPPQVDKDDQRWEEKTKIMEDLFRTMKQTPTNIKFKSAFELYGNLSNNDELMHPKYTTYTANFKNTVDYVFFTEQTMIVKNLMKIPTPEEIGDVALPNWRHPSDHLPLLATFELLDVKSKL